MKVIQLEKKRIFRAMLALAVFFGILALGYLLFGTRGEFDRKATYAEMQGIEIYYRDKNIVTPFVTSGNSGLRLVGFETEDKKFPYAWLALSVADIEDAKGVFLVGKAPPWKLSCAQVQELANKEKMASNVATFLRQHCDERAVVQ